MSTLLRRILPDAEHNEVEDAEDGEEEETGQIQYVDDGIHLFLCFYFQCCYVKQTSNLYML